jgi:hypothetical protein
MRFYEEDQQGLDLDWFAVDANGCVGHFTTAGRFLLPDSVASSKEDWERLRQYFRHDAPTDRSARMCPELPRIMKWRDEAARERYMRDFLAMASRGLFSYDAADLSADKESYIRVALPDIPLNISELPSDIQSALKRTRLSHFHFASAPEIPEQSAKGA